MLNPLLLAVAILAAGPEFEVQTLDGRTASGALVELDSEHLKIQTAAGSESFEINSLAAATRTGAVPAGALPKPAVVVQLVDGTLLPLADFTVVGQTARLALVAGNRLELPARAIRWVRFSHAEAPDEKIETQWAEMSEPSKDGDKLVVRKKGALDEIEGTAHDVAAETVQFEVDKEVVAVNRGKIEGLVYFHSDAAEAREPIGQVTLNDGARLAMLSAAMKEGGLLVKSPSGLELPIELGTITRLDYSTGKIVFLSDLEPQTASYAPLVSTKEDLPAIVEYYRYRRDQGFDGKPLATGGTSYRKGLSLASRTSLAYRLPGKFRVFKATVGIDDHVRPLGSVRLVVLGDGKSLWQADVRGSEPAQELDVDISGIKRLEIVADYGEQSDIGDRLDLCDARVSK